MSRFTLLNKHAVALALIFTGALAHAGDQEVRLGDPERVAREWGNSASLKIWEPYSEQERTAIGYDLKFVLDRAFGGGWRKARELTFVAKDGYRAVIPVTRILAHRALLAIRFEPVTTQAFQTVRRSDGKTIALGPYYLVWENIQDRVMRAEKDHGWPYQTVAIEIRTAEPIPARWVPGVAQSEQIRGGYGDFKSYCLNCHAVGGSGGRVGPELLKPVAVTTYWNRDWLRRWVADPNSIRLGTAMPAFTPPVSPQKKAQMIEGILNYIEWAASAPEGAK